MERPTTLQEAIQYFAEFENCRQFMVAVRWLDGKVRCPACGSEKVTYLQKARLYKCYGDHPKPKFSLKVGTVFEDSPIALEKWLPAVWLVVNCKNGVSSWELHRALGVTQKTAWFMLHRIRLAMQSGAGFAKIGGSGSEVEVDETFIGGKARNMHKEKRIKTKVREGNWGKTVVMGMLERGGHVKTKVIENRRKPALHAAIAETIEKGSQLYTDEHNGYMDISPDYVHSVVNHLENYVSGRVHTNGLENFWSLLKRGLNGTYVSVEPFHLFRYVDEQAFRYNNRATKDNPLNDADRFQLALSQIVGKRLTYNQLTGKTGGERTPL
jgi:transposase-like protein